MSFQFEDEDDVWDDDDVLDFPRHCVDCGETEFNCICPPD